ncbi:hypothetical protein GCM10028786_29950 [Flaviaesturariibacter terrae]
MLLLFGALLLLAVGYALPERRVTLSGPHFHFRYSRGIDTATMGSLAAALEESYPRIAADLATTPAAIIETNVYAERWRYVKATGHWSASGNIEGVAKLHFVAQAWSEPDSRKVAVHEFAHSVVLKLLIDNEPRPLDAARFDKKFAAFPTWLWEAVAVYEAGQFVDPRSLPWLAGGHYPGIAELDSRAQGGKIYSCGFTLVAYIRARYGQEGLLRLLRNWGDIGKTFGVTPAQFSAGWYAFLQARYGLPAPVATGHRNCRVRPASGSCPLPKFG